MGKSALRDVGFIDNKGKWSAKAKEYGVTSEKTFLGNKSAQDAAITEYNKKQWGYIKSYKSNEYVGKTYMDVKVTESGLLAASHLVGAKAVANALKTGKHVKDGNGTTAASYMNEFSGYDVSSIC